MQVTTNIQIDFTLPGFPETVHAMQQDEATRYVAIAMTAGGQPFTPPSGTSGVLAILKPDGTTCYYDAVGGTPAVVLSGSTATCLLVPEALTAVGEAKAALVLYNADGSRLTTFRFRLIVEETPVPDGVIESSSYYSILTQQIAQALTAAEAVQAVLDMTVSATTLDAGSAATVTKTTSGGVVNLAFGIPQGIQGNTGATGAQGEPGEGVPTGGTTGQALLKSGLADYAAAWNPVGNPNLLDNWDFTNPVNQRGVSGTISSTGYFIDRWQLASGTVQLTANGLVLNGTITQTTLLALSGVTASVKMYSGEATASYDGTIFTITSSGGCVAAAKLEMGSISTIENDAPASFPEQLAICQYFLFNSGESSISIPASIVGTNVIYFTMFLPGSLRTNPTLISSDQLSVFSGLSGGEATGFTFSFVASGSLLRIAANKNSHGLSNARLYITSLILSAEL